MKKQLIIFIYSLACFILLIHDGSYAIELGDHRNFLRDPIPGNANIYSRDFVKLSLRDKERSGLKTELPGTTLLLRSGEKNLNNLQIPKVRLNQREQSNSILEKNFSLKEQKYYYLNGEKDFLSAKINFPKDYLKDYKPWESKKRFWTAAGEIVLLEFIPFAMSAYLKDWEGVEEINWTKISFKSVWHNLSSGWFYDGDNFLTNFYAHPYHGSLFYNAGRTNGYNFWESSGFAATGSAVWEHFMETWEPAFNDWVLTTLNGINLGEITYRLATLVTDNQARGSNRMWTEIAGALINPVRGFNRLISGETHRVFANPYWRTPDNLSLSLNAGLRKLDKVNGENFATESTEEGLFELQFVYGSETNRDLKVPFSTFRINMSIATGKPYFAQLQGVGHLFGFKMKETKTMKQGIVTTLNYDYVNNPGFLFGAASFLTEYSRNYKVGKETNIIASGGIRLIPMGATPNDYFAGPEGRNYDFGPGTGFTLGGTLRQGKWNVASLIYNSGWIWTQSDPADSKHHLHYLILNLEYPMKPYFSVGLSAGSYWRNSFYKNFDDVHFKTPIIRLYFKTVII